MRAIVFGVAPYEGYAILTGVGGYTLLLLLILTSLSVLAFFTFKVNGANFWKTKLAPLISFLLLSSVGFLATVNLEVLTGNVKIAETLLVIIFGTLAAGCLYARRLKKTKPAVYAAIGRQNI